MPRFRTFLSKISGTAKPDADDIETLRNSKLLDPIWYRQTYPDIGDGPIDVARHYLERGAREGRNPHRLFNTKIYLEQNPDVATSGMNPLLHYIRYGQKEGRPPQLEPRRTVRSAEPRLLQPNYNFAAGGLSRQIVTIHDADSYADHYNAAIIVHASAIAARQQSTLIIDIGADLSVAAAAPLASAAQELLLVDWRPRKPVADHSAVILAQIEFPADLDRLNAALDDRPTLFVVRHVLETLQDPRPLLRMLRRALRRHPGNRLLIATLERDASTTDADEAPRAMQHARLWNRQEFAFFLQGSGFEIASQRVLQSPGLGTSLLFELSCDEASYAAFLSRSALPSAAPHLVLTTEHARALHTRGVGAYHQNAEEAAGLPRLTLFCGSDGLPLRWLDFIREQGWLHCADLCGYGARARDDIAVVAGDDVLDAVLQALFIYDTVTLIEYQDYLGIGARVAQAKCAGLLPPSVTVIAYAHGNHFYLDQAEDRIPRGRDLAVDLNERISLEQADCVVFPSRFLRRLIVETQGLRLRSERFQPYPIRFDPLPDTVAGDVPIDTLIFHGQQSVRKGYDDFCAAVLTLWTKPEHRAAREQIKTVIMTGVATPDPRFTGLQGLDIEYGEYAHDDVIAMLRRHAERALVVLPYRGDNQPLSFFEAVESGADVIAYRAGGIPELVPEELAQDFLCEPDASALTVGIIRTITRPGAERHGLRMRLLRHLRDAGAKAIAGYRAMIAEFLTRPDRPSAQGRPGDVTVVVPNLNGPGRFFDDLRFGLANSFKAPVLTIIVDDGSTPEYFETAEAAAAAIPNARVQPVSHRGLAGARNAGLALAETPYVCVHDNDDVISNHFLGIATAILDQNPDIAAVTSWYSYFRDGESWAFRDYANRSYRPAGQDLGCGLSENVFGGALAVYRTNVLKTLGGWNAGTEAMWEDWELFVRMTVAGHKIWVIPREMFLCRHRPGSMSRTYSRFWGSLRLTAAFQNLPQSEAVSLTRALISLSKSW
jgi:glycosyltransferase involved in cell wall biosynthesis/GT2 family glycosyltransferase